MLRIVYMSAARTVFAFGNAARIFCQSDLTSAGSGGPSLSPRKAFCNAQCKQGQIWPLTTFYRLFTAEGVTAVLIIGGE